MTPLSRAALITAATATATFAVDRAAKVAVEHGLDEGERARGPLGIGIVRRTNDRPVGSAMTAAGGALALGVAGSASALRRPVLLQVGAGMVAGAMLGNLVDRVTGDRAVTDYLPTPLGVLNAADVLIGAGIVMAGIGLAIR
jgi:lipoprotein signal peptidase